MKSLEPTSKKSKKKKFIVHYAGLGPYYELKDVNEEKEARKRATKAKQQTLKGLFIWYVRKIFLKTNISDPLIRRRTCAYQGVRNVSFLEYFAYALNG